MGDTKQANLLEREPAMSKYDPIAYQYEADRYCPACTEARFGRGPHGHIAEGALDREGNPVSVIAPWDEWADYAAPGHWVLECGACLTVIEEVDVPCDTCGTTGLVTDEDGTEEPCECEYGRLQAEERLAARQYEGQASLPL
jgi:hypothetical protein